MPDNKPPQSNENDLLSGRDVEDLDLAELQKLADHVYEELQRELLLERERMGFTQGWPGRRY
jgi:hypothetical protein